MTWWNNLLLYTSGSGTGGNFSAGLDLFVVCNYTISFGFMVCLSLQGKYAKLGRVVCMSLS
jgi:hypothetical protein